MSQIENEKVIEQVEEENDRVKVINIANEVRSSFLEYAMSVIVSRALPDVRDGMKPVHRRIIYAMNELGITSSRPHKKSARIVGDVMAKYHPHGDTAIYESLVRLAQDFSSRYPLVDGHGNFGSIDGDSAAAMRYTEARMAKIAHELVRDIDKNTIDFTPNYDGEEKEPVVLPARVPNVLINGTSGIAVGMATNIPPHNLIEVVNAAIAILKNPEIDTMELLTNYIYGPDFPTGGFILGKTGIRKAFETGNGSIVIRSKTHFEETDSGRTRIIVTEIPYQVNKVTMIEKIADLVKNKIIEGIADLRDESNREGIRVVVELKRDAVPEVVLNQLYKLSQLQVSYAINLLVLVNGEPRILGVKSILQEYLKHQKIVIKRRTQYDLDSALDRQHILQGLRIAGLNIDEVIRIIRFEDSPEDVLMTTYNLSEKQVRAILDMRLQRLKGIEQIKIEAELTELDGIIANLNDILNNNEHLESILETELIEVRDKFGDERRTQISLDSYDIEDEDLIPQENILISLTNNGYIKRVTTDTYRAQNRGGKGIKGMTTNTDDVVDKLLSANTHTDVLFFTSYGKVYRLRGYQIPEFSRVAKGIPVINLLHTEKDELVRAMLPIDAYDETHQLVFITKLGVIKRVSLDNFANIRQNGKIAVGLRDGDELMDVKFTNGSAEILIASSGGKVVRFNELAVRSMGRTASGVKGIDVQDGFVVGASTSQEGSLILALSENGYGKMSKLEDYRLTSRGTKGVLTINATEKVGNLVTIRAVNGDEDLLVTTTKGIVIRTSLSQVAISGRNTQGVRIIRLDEDQKVASIAVVEKEIVEDEVENTDNLSSEVKPDETNDINETDINEEVNKEIKE